MSNHPMTNPPKSQVAVEVKLGGDRVYGLALTSDPLQAEFNRLDLLSRQRALTDAESRQLERCMRNLARPSRARPEGYDEWVKSGGRIG